MGGCEGERGCSAALHVSGLCLPSLQADVQHQDVRPHGWRRCHRLGAGGPGQYPGGLGLSVRKRGGGGRPSASEPGKQSWRWCLRSRRCALHTRGVQAARFTPRIARFGLHKDSVVRRCLSCGRRSAVRDVQCEGSALGTAVGCFLLNLAFSLSVVPDFIRKL